MPLINVNQTNTSTTSVSDGSNNAYNFVSNSANLPPINSELSNIANKVNVNDQVNEFKFKDDSLDGLKNNEINDLDLKDSLESKIKSMVDVLGESTENFSQNSETLVSDNKISNISNETVASNPFDVKIDESKKLDSSLNEINIDSQILEKKDLPNTKVESGSFNTLDEILNIAISRNASDVHLTTGYKPLVRVDGKLISVSTNILTEENVISFVDILLKDRINVSKLDIKEYDMTYTSSGRRFRVNIFKQMGKFSLALRVIPERIKDIRELDLPNIISEFPKFPNGLVLVTGPTGSGKSTTIAAILNQINLSLPKHIVTLEDPIEFVFPKGMSLVDQREFGLDFLSWNNALRAVLRQDPDVVLVGEMRDLETVEAALQIAETGHLVFATVHTNGAAETINRVIDVFESQKQDQIRVQLASVLRAVISQKLVPLQNGGRKAIVEVLISTPSIRSAIRDKKTFQIDNIMKTSADLGMIPIEKSIVDLIKKGLISKEVGKSLSNNPNEIDLLLQ